jgi:hypothetical protein
LPSAGAALRHRRLRGGCRGRADAHRRLEYAHFVHSGVRATDAEGKLFRPLAYTKTFAIAASVVLALTLVPVLSYYVLKPVRWSRRALLLLALLAGVPSVFATHYLLRWGLGEGSRWSGWPTAIAVGIMAAAAVYRMGRERLVPLEKNLVSRAIFAIFRPALRWTLNHKAAFLSVPVALVVLGLLIWLGFERVAYPLEAGLKAVSVDPTSWWRGSACDRRSPVSAPSSCRRWMRARSWTCRRCCRPAP